ncbi:MAG: nucleoside 2-deoxyribosyltransferase [Pseudomonadota bacterium]
MTDKQASNTSSAPRIYLAGPDVFLPNARDVGHAKCARVAAVGGVGVFPLDAELELTGLPPYEAARRIALANEDLMRSCDGMVANLSPFHGVSMDSGTAFEVGFMRALGRPIEAYTSTPDDYATRARAWRATNAAPVAGAYDRNGQEADGALEIEDFGLSENLMIAIGVADGGGAMTIGDGQETPFRDADAFEVAVTRLVARLNGAPPRTSASGARVR